MILGYDLGGTKCAICLARVQPKLEILDRRVLHTKPFSQMWPLLVKAGKDLLRSHTDASSKLSAIGISCGGPLDSRRGVLLSPPNLPGWEDIPIVELLQGEFHVPAFLQNDANACALAEWQLGAGCGCDDMVFLTMGTGFGAGIISGGKLLYGVNGLAGEIGHVRLCKDGPSGYGKAGSVEGFCSGGGIAQLAQYYTKQRIRDGHTPAWHAQGIDPGQITAKLIGRYADEGNADALEILRLAGERLGEAASILIDLLNPSRIIIGSIFVRCERWLRPAMEKALRREALPPAAQSCVLLPASIGEHLGDIASVMVACQALGITVPAPSPCIPMRPSVQTHRKRLFERYPTLEVLSSPLSQAFELLRKSYRAGGKLLICGNGGSAADADHIVGELMKGFLLPRSLGRPDLPAGLQGALPAIALTQHLSLSTAFGNDVDPQLVFAQQIIALGRPGDVLLAISTSGNSRNVVLAAQTARAVGMRVIALTGQTGGDLASLSDVLLAAPAISTPEVQEYHLPLYHTLCAMLEEEFFGQSSTAGEDAVIRA